MENHDPDVTKPSGGNGWTKKHDEMFLPNNLSDILEHQNLDQTNDDKVHINDVDIDI